MERMGLIAGSGKLPALFARGAREQGLTVVAVGHTGETEPELSEEVESLDWVRVGQLGKIATLLRRRGIRRAVMAGGILAGPNRPFHRLMSYPLSAGVSDSDGICGAARERPGVVTPSATILPASIWGKAVGVMKKASSMLPPATSMAICAAPR